MLITSKGTGREISIFPIGLSQEQILATVRKNIIKKVESQFSRLNEVDKSLLINTAASGDIGIISAKFETICTVNDVLIALPPDDRCLKNFPAHFCAIIDKQNPKTNPDIVFIPQHWRRGLPLDNGEQIYRNFYTEKKELLGKNVVADLTFQIKSDLISGQKNLMVNCENIRPTSSCSAEYSAKFNTMKGKHPSPLMEIPIPGIADKCVCVIKHSFISFKYRAV